MKENKTTDELIQYLISKNVMIDDIESAKKNIEKYTYYGIIDTYKYIFKDKNNNYKPNVSFEEILSLFLFDKAIRDAVKNNCTICYAKSTLPFLGTVLTNRFPNPDSLSKHCSYFFISFLLNFLPISYNQLPIFHICVHLFFTTSLKSIFLNYILEVELIIKSKIANLFSSKYGIKDYLKKDNFDENANIRDVQNLIDEINKEITGKHNRKHNAVKHYLDKYNFVPPFVLVKILSFGTISKMYGLMKQSDRQEISKTFKFSDNILRQMLKNLASIRNISAHSDRLFCYRSIFYISFKNIDNTYKNKDGSTNLYMLTKCMTRLLDEESANKFEAELDNQTQLLKSKLSSIKIEDVLRIIGYNV